ncbi:hypothetical protein [Daejeonella sp.]|uniref:hypothetical protein n=1 Tax=Daejeonella sp. TaxID=2805397 RepID=UPI0030BC02F0
MITSITAPIARDTFKGSPDPRKRVQDDDDDDDDDEPKESKRVIVEDDDEDFDIPLDDDIKGFDEYDDEEDDDY